MKAIKRRDFLKSSLGAAAAVSAFSPGKSVSANDKIMVGVMGVGGRGTRLAEWFASRPDVEVAYICDVNERRFETVLEALEKYQDKDPKTVKDFRRILDDPQVDALINATPDHWHALGTIMACQAGKDVYVEKPLAHDIREGQKMVEAARKYKRVVQVGTQTRSAAYVKKAADFIKEGSLGEVHLVRVYFMMQHPEVPKGPEEPVPDGFDWDMWCGPAPKAPYSPGHWWFERWDYSCGGIAGDAIHQLDLARMLLGLGYPDSVYQAGGVHFFTDGREIPDTQIATFEYGKLTFVLEAALWMPYMKKIPNSVRDSDQFPDWPFCSTKVEIFGSKAFMNFGRQGGGWQAYDENSAVFRSEPGRQGDKEHIENFINCMRTRERPVADVEEAHISTALCHLANISYRVGNRKLKFNPETHNFPGDTEADKYLKREYRQPWVVPDEV
ncbi:MAG TPA: Gfo/Idh/MocA family oxidoreductase [archaeon]|nr:Gfo/Idh/MocA family oxidoreductase [archaeon]